MTNKKEIIKTVGVKVREARTDKGLSIEKLAEQSGLAYSQIIRIESGKINTSIHQLFILANSLEVDITDFFDGVNKKFLSHTPENIIIEISSE